ncbi:MAG: LPS export ABC transporter periplasmic protein LptC [Steroidobacteraceae bacterium]
MRLWGGILLLVLMLLGGAFLMGRGKGPIADTADVQASGAEQGYVALGAQIVETGADGAPLYSLDAERIEQRPSTGDVTLQKLTMHYHLDGKSSWQLTANNGLLPGGTTLVALTGAVRANGMLPNSKLAAEIATEQLDFDTKTQDLASRQLVTIRLAGQRLSARGLTASLKHERVRLESAVHGRYSR